MARNLDHSRWELRLKDDWKKAVSERFIPFENANEMIRSLPDFKVISLIMASHEWGSEIKPLDARQLEAALRNVIDEADTQIEMKRECCQSLFVSVGIASLVCGGHSDLGIGVFQYLLTESQHRTSLVESRNETLDPLGRVFDRPDWKKLI